MKLIIRIITYNARIQQNRKSSIMLIDCFKKNTFQKIIIKTFVDEKIPVKTIKIIRFFFFYNPTTTNKR